MQEAEPSFCKLSIPASLAYKYRQLQPHSACLLPSSISPSSPSLRHTPTFTNSSHIFHRIMLFNANSTPPQVAPSFGLHPTRRLPGASGLQRSPQYLCDVICGPWKEGARHLAGRRGSEASSTTHEATKMRELLFKRIEDALQTGVELKFGSADGCGSIFDPLDDQFESFVALSVVLELSKPRRSAAECWTAFFHSCPQIYHVRTEVKFSFVTGDPIENGVSFKVQGDDHREFEVAAMLSA
ncbi:hypothetical protein KEM48_010486 [Puccinia striiformis f. sp. tritici PST-130]|nr:hypothetical protein KEM48_010486 [Puccinia striiformis f. sp. tritici PST-130]